MPSAICELCDEPVDAATIHEHYEHAHPERHAGDWKLWSWPDGVQVLIELPA